MDINALRNQLSIRCKNGLPFLLAACVIWSIVLLIFRSSFGIMTKNILIFYSTGIMFPLAILLAKIIKADWKTNDHPLGALGLYLNMAPVISVLVAILGWNASETNLWYIPLVMLGALVILSLWVYVDYKGKVRQVQVYEDEVQVA